MNKLVKSEVQPYTGTQFLSTPISSTHLRYGLPPVLRVGTVSTDLLESYFT